MKINDCIICGNPTSPGFICKYCRDLEEKEYNSDDKLEERPYDDETGEYLDE